MIEIKDLQVSYQNKQVLTNINLGFQSGKLTAILGPNGAGKSTLLKAILGMIPYKGQVLLNKKAIKDQLNKVAYVEQKNNVDPNFPITVKECVSLGLYPKHSFFHKLDKTDWQKVNVALESVGLDDYSNRQISQLSGGQFQRMLIARCLVQDADYLLLDEPFVGIDVVSEDIIVHLLKALRNQGKTILIVHHDLSKVRKYFDDVVILNRELIAAGAVETTFNTSNIKKAFSSVLPMEVF